MCKLLSLYLVVTILVIHGTSASKISLTATPSFISPGNTQTLTIRCSVSSNNSTNQEPIVGRRDVADIIRPHLKRQTEAVIAHITSIVITRQDHGTGANETIASVTTFEPATAHADLGKVHVSGTTVSTTSGEQGFLELTWQAPTAHQYGIYTCEVFALNTDNHPDEVVQTVQIGISQPTTQELLLYIADLERRTTILENKVKNIQGGNVQTGVTTCVQGTNDYHIVFASPFDKIPTVITALAGAQNGEAFVYSPTVLDLTSADFTLRCKSFQQTNVVWVAL